MSDPNSIGFVVDDDPLVRDSVADLLGSAGPAPDVRREQGERG